MDSLQVNDVIYLEKGMTIQYNKLPVWIYKNHHPYSDATTDGHLNIGEVRRRQSHVKPLQDEAEKLVKFVFEYLEVKYDADVLQKYVRHVIKEPQEHEFMIPEGEYVVTDVKLKDRERKVFCQTFDPKPGQEIFQIYFFQNSNFYSNINKVRILKSLK
jgi:hypothetical protein